MKVNPWSLALQITRGLELSAGPEEEVASRIFAAACVKSFAGAK
jgi:hypothetical protein